MKAPAILHIKYYRAIVFFDNRQEYEQFLEAVSDSKPVLDPDNPNNGNMPNIYIAGLPLPNDREDTPEDAHRAIQKVREWVEHFHQVQGKQTSTQEK